MIDLVCRTRYLTTFDAWRLPHVHCGVLVLGSGIAGLRAALAASRHTHVLLATKLSLESSNTYEAQGGIAGVVSPEDSFELHVKDTLGAGNGLCDRDTVELVVRETPRRIQDLVRMGAQFDRKGGDFALGREGGHSAPRIIQARGDATGKEVARTLIETVKGNGDIQLVDHGYAIDLVTHEGRCVGAIVQDERWGAIMVWARQTILATGGAGQLYRETSNPDVATADGVAMAYRAGAELRDLEFIQFHPTTLYIAGASRTLISETLRGYGAILRNSEGEAFMERYHPLKDLAPRDAVSRAIFEEMRLTGATSVFLDFTHLESERVLDRFPTLRGICADFDLDIGKNPVPVRPSAHYCMGGVTVNLDGATNVPSLHACGEVASTGLHGANRLGSNSLPEGLVYGARAGEEAGRLAAGLPEIDPPRIRHRFHEGHRGSINVVDVRNALRSMMARNVGIERDAERLGQAAVAIDSWCRYVMAKEFDTPAAWELQNMLTVASLVTESASRRQESRGGHFRTDFPQTDDAGWRRHLTITREGGYGFAPVVGEVV